MLKYSEACKMVAEGFDLEELNYGKKKYKPEDKHILQNVLTVENRIFQIYLKTGKYRLTTFPYNELKENYVMTKQEMNKIAKMLLQNNWSPFIHVKNTRKKFETITNGFW